MEEGDGRLVLHVTDMVNRGASSVLIKSTGTDVVILVLSYFFKLAAKGMQALWVLYGTGAKQRQLPCHSIAASLGEEKCAAPRGFHAFTGCDTVIF